MEVLMEPLMFLLIHMISLEIGTYKINLKIKTGAQETHEVLCK